MKKIKNKYCDLQLEKKICNEYRIGIDSLRDVAKRLNTNHKLVSRVLKRNNIKIIKALRKPLSDEHKKKIKEKSKNRCYTKGWKMPKKAVYKNMASHFRFNIEYEWLLQFEDLEKLKILNKSISKKRDIPNLNIIFYKKFIMKFYYDKQFNLIYNKYIQEGRKKLLKPSLDHIKPKSKNGSNKLNNLQFLTWFENFCKRDMLQTEWNDIKNNIEKYFIKDMEK